VPEAHVEAATIDLPWGAWHGDRRKRLLVPAGWQLRELPMADAPALGDREIDCALDAPLNAPSLQTLAAGKRHVAIAIDDITRPTRTAPLLRRLVDRLTAAGVPRQEITVIVATGAHGRATERDFQLKTGELAGDVRVTSHDPAGDLASTGVSLGGVEVRLNRHFAEADLRIGIGSVMPHPFAGFSGGGKIVVPGLADLEVLSRTHRFALMGFRGGGGLAGNRFRTEMEAAVARIGLHWTVNVAVNADRDTAFVAAGDLVTAHRAAAAAAARIGATPGRGVPLDALILNAYPKDSELLQLESAFVALRNGMLGWLAPGAPVVLTGACPEGLGHHGLFGPGGGLFRVPLRRTFLGDHPLWIFAPDLRETAVRMVFPDEYPFFDRWERLVDALQRELRPDAAVGVVPCGPLQIGGSGRQSEPAGASGEAR